MIDFRPKLLTLSCSCLCIEKKSFKSHFLVGSLKRFIFNYRNAFGVKILWNHYLTIVFKVSVISFVQNEGKVFQARRKNLKLSELTDELNLGENDSNFNSPPG